MFLYFRCECAVKCDWWVSVEYRAVIMLMFLKGNTLQTILEEMTAVSRLVSTPPYSVSHYWYSHFKCGWMLVETVTIPLSQLLRVTIILVKCCLTIQKLADRVSEKEKKKRKKSKLFMIFCICKSVSVVGFSFAQPFSEGINCSWLCVKKTKQSFLPN